MELTFRPVSGEGFDTFARAVERAFGEVPTREELDLWRTAFEPARSLAALDGDQIVGTTAAESLVLTVPGAALPMAGVTAVGVLPSHRRRGILRELMRRQLEDVHELGEPLAGLWASESSIYGRFGYGMAARSARLQIDRERTAFIRPYEPGGRMVLEEKEKALEIMPSVYDRVLRGQPGMFGLSSAHWQIRVADLESSREGASPLFFALYESGDGVDGYVTYRLKHDWNADDIPAGTVKVQELMAATTDAYAALWQYCFGIDLRKTIEARFRPMEEPLQYMLAEPRQLRMSVSDSLWLRPVDVAASLAGRRYSSPGRLVFEVHDAFCPWNEGRYELEGGPDGAQCRHTESAPDLVLEAADLGAAYLGGARFHTLNRAGRVSGEPSALLLADTMFGWDPLPWCPVVF
jgi:predicted acetyltransferase